MTEKELGKLNRRQLLEMMLEQTKRAQELENELQEKNKQLAEKEALLADKRITLEKAGSIADASLSISKVFEAAQLAADTYLKNIEAHSKRGDELLENAKKRSEAMLAEAKKRSEAMLAEAKKRSENMLAEAKKRSAVLEKQTADRVKAFKAEIEKLNFDQGNAPSE